MGKSIQDEAALLKYFTTIYTLKKTTTRLNHKIIKKKYKPGVTVMLLKGFALVVYCPKKSNVGKSY